MAGSVRICVQVRVCVRTLGWDAARSQASRGGAGTYSRFTIRR
ncbi:hypothetical protein [Paenibacillus sp. UNC496MF]|nr:hypothetical protein [Paenibacillus sp. UNC496MF]